MRFDIKKEANILVLTPLVKSIDSSNSVSFKSQGLELIKEGNHYILLNLTNIDFIDSNGLGSIISIFKAITEKGNLAIYGTKKTVISLFKMTRMDRVFPMFDNESSALQALRKKSDLHKN